MAARGRLRVDGGATGREGTCAPDGGWREWARAVRAWFFSDAWSAAAAWLGCALALVAVLAWFFVCSPFGAPATPVYAGF